MDRQPALVAPSGLRNPVFRRLQIRAYEHAIACGGPCCCNTRQPVPRRGHHGNSRGLRRRARSCMRLRGRPRRRPKAPSTWATCTTTAAGVADYQRAYECFAHEALSADNPEGYWKLGGLYASGNGVRQSDRMAWTLSKAYKIHGSALFCRAAHRYGRLPAHRHRRRGGGTPGALRLYNEAEAGYYTLIDAGMTYYIPQLQQAIEGQEKARWVIQHRFLHFD